MRSQSILFVDRTNTCGSPFALAAFQRYVIRLGLTIDSSSAAISRECAGEPAEPAAMAIAALHGLDLVDHRARQLRLQDTRQFSDIVALDRDSLAMMRAMRPDCSGLSLIDDHTDAMMAGAISDLLTGGPADMAMAFRAIDAAVRGLAAEFADRRLSPMAKPAPILAVLA